MKIFTINSNDLPLLEKVRPVLFNVNKSQDIIENH